jgi:hypothetical protein
MRQGFAPKDSYPPTVRQNSQKECTESATTNYNKAIASISHTAGLSMLLPSIGGLRKVLFENQQRSFENCEKLLCI